MVVVDDTAAPPEVWLRGERRLRIHPLWSPDGRSLVYVRSLGFAGSELRRLSFPTGVAGAETILLAGAGHVLHPAWSPDGSRIAFSGSEDGDFDLWVLELATGQASPGGGRAGFRQPPGVVSRRGVAGVHDAAPGAAGDLGGGGLRRRGGVALGGGTPPGAGAGVALGRRHREGRSGRAPLWALPQLFALGLLGGCAGAPADPPSGSAIAEALAPHEIAATTLPAEGARGDPSRATAPAAIDRVRVTPKLLDRGGAVADGHPPGAGTFRIALALSQPADLSLEIGSFATGRAAPVPLRRLLWPGRGAGPQVVSWDGRDAAGQPVPPGVYALRLATRNAAGTHSWGDLSPAAGEEVLVQRLTYDRASRQLRFHLPAASYLRVQMRLQDYPHLRTVLDWEPRPAGWHTRDLGRVGSLPGAGAGRRPETAR